MKMFRDITPIDEGLLLWEDKIFEIFHVTSDGCGDDTVVCLGNRDSACIGDVVLSPFRDKKQEGMVEAVWGGGGELPLASASATPRRRSEQMDGKAL